jgi:hypothetical protein
VCVRIIMHDSNKDGIMARWKEGKGLDMDVERRRS